MNIIAGFGGLAAGVYAVTKAIGYVQERIDRRQESAKDNQQFDFTLLAAGNNKAEQDQIKKAYIDNSQLFGMAINRESAVAYSNMIQGFRAQGKTLNQAIQLQADQAAVFRVGNLNKEQQYSAALQLNQGYGKDRFTGGDLRPLTDALGTRLTTILYQAIGKALGYHGDQNKLAGFVLQAQHDGKVNGAMVQQGMRDIVAQSQELLERHKGSIDAQSVRVENDKYLQQDQINSDPELTKALGERLSAERELIAASKGLAKAQRDLDLGFIKLETNMLRMLAGRNVDDTIKTPTEIAASVGAGSTIEGYSIDPTVIGSPKESTGAPVAKDPITRLYDWLTNAPDYSKGPASKLKVGEQADGASLTFPKLDMDKFNLPSAPEINGEWNKFRPETRADAIQRAVADATRYSFSTLTAPQTTTNTNNNTTTNEIGPTSITLTINNQGHLDETELAEKVREIVAHENEVKLRQLQSTQKVVK